MGKKGGAKRRGKEEQSPRGKGGGVTVVEPGERGAGLASSPAREEKGNQEIRKGNSPFRLRGKKKLLSGEKVYGEKTHLLGGKTKENSFSGGEGKLGYRSKNPFVMRERKKSVEAGERPKGECFRLKGGKNKKKEKKDSNLVDHNSLKRKKGSYLGKKRRKKPFL